MKYIKLFEGFESDILTRTISFLKGKKDLSKEKIQIFLNDIKKLSLYDLPISKISDSDIKYLKTSSAIKIRNTNEAVNSYGIYCIKYWFSLENGYLGFTGTGNRTSDYEKVKSRSNDDDDRRYPKTFTKDQLSYIYNSLKIKTGILKPVTDYHSLNTGDDILFAFGETYRSYSEGIVRGKIFVEGNRLFALHNSGSEGSEPSEDVSRFGFQLSWSLGHKNSPGDDFCLLNTYVDDDQPLRYIVNGEEVKFESGNIKVNSDYDFNLPCTYRTLYAWDNSNIGKVKFIEDSDFAIVLYLDDILNKGIDKVSEISLGRKKSRLGSSFLLDNESIRNENIDRYLTKLFSQHGIDTKRRELIKLEKLVNSMLCGKFSMIDMFSDSYIVDGIRRLGDSISSLITQMDEDKDDYSYDDVLYKYNNLLKFYKDKRSSSALKYNDYSKNLIKLQKSGNEELIKVFDEIIKIGDKITKYISASKLESLEDIRMIYFKLKSINDVFNDKNFILSRGISDIMHRFSYTYNQEDFDNLIITRYINLPNSNLSNSNDLKKLKLIEKYIDSVLK